MKICPECDRTLVHKKHKIFHCWVCPDGHGTYYPPDELEKIMRAVSGLGELKIPIWENSERYSVLQSALMSPVHPRPLYEIRDKSYPSIVVYGDPVSRDLWVHTGEEEKLLDHLKQEALVDSVGGYVFLAAKEAGKIFDDDEPLGESAGHLLTALKLLGSRILRALPNVTI